MFDNIGGKLKKLAVILFIVGVIASLVCAIVYGRTVEVYSHRTETTFNFWLFLLILVGGCGASYVEVMALYAFGQLVENSDTSTQLALNDSKERGNEKRNAAPSYQYGASARKPVTDVPKKNCPYCGARNNLNNKTCFACGKTIE